MTEAPQAPAGEAAAPLSPVQAPAEPKPRRAPAKEMSVSDAARAMRKARDEKVKAAKAEAEPKPKTNGRTAAAPETQPEPESAPEAQPGPDDETEDRQPAEEAPAAEAEEAEQSASTEGEPDDPGTGPFEPPAKWSAEDKAAFSKLPPEAQGLLLGRHKSMEADYTRRSQTLAEAEKSTKAAQQAAASDQQHFREGARVLKALLQTQMADVMPSAEHMQRLRESDPAEWSRVRLEAMDRQAELHGKLQTVLQAEQAQNAKAEAKAKAELDRRLAAAQSKAYQLKPDWRDPAKWSAANTAMTELATSHYGFTTEELAVRHDPRLYAILHDAMLYHGIQKAKATATAPERRVTPQPRPVQKPGSAQPDAKAQARSNAMAAARSTLQKHGTVESGVAMLRAARRK